MIKTIKKIDLQGNEVWQDVVVCNRCKRTLEPDEFIYETKWTAWHPVKMEVGCAYGFGQGSNPIKHICEKCQEEVEAFINGDFHPEGKPTSKLTTFSERVESCVSSYENESTEALKEHFHSCMCTREAAQAIKIILKKRGTSW